MTITLYFNEYCFYALSDVFGQQTTDTVENKLAEVFDMFYQEYVPEEQICPDGYKASIMNI